MTETREKVSAISAESPFDTFDTSLLEHFIQFSSTAGSRSALKAG